MLTADLVQAKVGRTHVEPRYIRTDHQENVDLAASLIDIFERNRGERKRDLESELAELLGNGTEFLLHRGLAKLLLDRYRVV